MSEEEIEKEAERVREIAHKSIAYNPKHASVEQSKDFLRTLIAFLQEDHDSL